MVVAANPATVLVQQLSDARRRGEGFADAWPRALSSALAAAPNATERQDWATVLGEMVATWRGAFERQSASRHERALLGLLDDERVVPLPDRECLHCHGEIGPERKRGAIFCSRDCQRAVVEERRLAAAA